MAQVNLFLLLPETNPTNQWMRPTKKAFHEVTAYETLIQDLKKTYESIAIERYRGFYDPLNIKNFLCLYDTLDDCYPSAPKQLLRGVISRYAFINWRDEQKQSPDTDYQIFNQPVTNSTFCEIAEHKKTVSDDNYSLLNHHASTIQARIVVTINNKSTIEIDNVKDEEEILKWFAQNRLPPRNFHNNPKHGKKTQRIDGKIISPLRCSAKKAQTLLDTAIGNSDKELYNLDPDCDEIIILKYEGCTPQNMYHGYHVPKDSTEVPFEIKKKLTGRKEL